MSESISVKIMKKKKDIIYTYTNKIYNYSTLYTYALRKKTCIFFFIVQTV